MKMETVKKRLAKNRPMIAVTLRMPEDVVDDLKRIAPLRGFSGYQALMRAYVGAGLREDLDRFEQSAPSVSCTIDAYPKSDPADAGISGLNPRPLDQANK